MGVSVHPYRLLVTWGDKIAYFARGTPLSMLGSF